MKDYISGVTEVRENLSSFLDQAEVRPSFVSRRRTMFIVMPDSFIELFAPEKIKVTIQRDKEAAKNPKKYSGAFFAYGDVFEDIVGWGDTAEEAYTAFKHNLADFCSDFYENFSLYASASNRKKQIPYVVKIVNHIARGFDVAELLSIGEE